MPLTFDNLGLNVVEISKTILLKELSFQSINQQFIFTTHREKLLTRYKIIQTQKTGRLGFNNAYSYKLRW